ncbi:MAG TPA: hypothetical protein VKA81_10630 [Verrucomicrobiae bacterium]|nr:hypothetical protein [Verrucomicrobiae bacterium]
MIKSSSDERISAGLPAAREHGVRLGRRRILDRHVKSVAKLSRKGLFGRRIAAQLDILLDQCSPSSNEREMTQFDEQCEATIKTISHWPVILSVRNF